MTTAYHHLNVPDEKRGKYVVARYTNSGPASDYLHEWDDKYGAAFTRIGYAMTFDDKGDAERAAIKAKRLVPKAVEGFGFRYDVELVA